MSSRIIIVVPTMNTKQDVARQLQVPPELVHYVRNTPESNLGVVGSLQAGYERTTEPIIACIHDDVIVHDSNWIERVLTEFDDPEVGVVGFCGALAHGADDLYKVPYRLNDLARFGVLSNMDDAEVHGERFTGSHDVAVLDGFSLIVRRSLLDACGGWHPERWTAHHLYDYVICAQARRFGYRVRVVGVASRHIGGVTATSSVYQEWATGTKWGSDVNMHIAGHRMFYDEFTDVMPWRVEDTRYEHGAGCDLAATGDGRVLDASGAD